MIRSMFKIPGHRIFGYTPQFYNENEEAVKKAIKRKKFLDGLTEEEAEKAYQAERLRLSIRQARSNLVDRKFTTGHNSGKKDRTGLRVLFIFLVLCLLTWFILS